MDLADREKMFTFDNTIHFSPIGFVSSPYKEKLGVPKQAGLVKSATGEIILNADQRFLAAIQYLDTFSHLWIVFVFDRKGHNKWKPTVRPPRVNAPRKVGVFATRSPHRPNAVGISAVKLEGIQISKEGRIKIAVSGLDLMDGTPVLDLKPYIPLADSIPKARTGWIHCRDPKYKVHFSKDVLRALKNLFPKNYNEKKNLLRETLAFDPRPNSQRRSHPIESAESQGKKFGFQFLGLDLKCKIEKSAVLVTHIKVLPTANA